MVASPIAAISIPSTRQEVLRTEASSSSPLAVQSGTFTNSSVGIEETPAEREVREEKEHRDAKIRRKVRSEFFLLDAAEVRGL